MILAIAAAVAAASRQVMTPEEAKEHARNTEEKHLKWLEARNWRYTAPPYNQRKARKLARQTGMHPANPKHGRSR